MEFVRFSRAVSQHTSNRIGLSLTLCVAEMSYLFREGRGGDDVLQILCVYVFVESEYVIHCPV